MQDENRGNNSKINLYSAEESYVKNIKDDSKILRRGARGDQSAVSLNCTQNLNVSKIDLKVNDDFHQQLKDLSKITIKEENFIISNNNKEFQHSLFDEEFQSQDSINLKIKNQSLILKNSLLNDSNNINNLNNLELAKELQEVN
jgi:hypothetical protein